MIVPARTRNEPTTLFTIRLTQQERAALHAYATANDLRLAQAVRRFIREAAAKSAERNAA